MNLSFYEKLSETQKAYAEKIAERARSMGVPPELAVAVAYKESGLNPSVKAGSAGEIGIMQIRPMTAKEMGFSVDDIKNPEKNIEAGLKYLKKSLDLSEGDPRLAAAGYNAGVNHPFFSSKDQTLPSTTVDYLRDLKEFGAFTGAPERKPVEVETPPTTLDSLEAQKQIDKVYEDVARGRGELAGLGAGSALSAARAIKPAAKGVAQFLGRATEEGKLAADARAGIVPEVPPAAPAGQAPAGPRAPGPAQLGTPGTFPRATGPGSATYNYGRAFGLPEIEAGRALTTGKEAGGVWDLLGKRQEALTGIQQRFPTETYVENPRFGGLMTPGQGAGAGPKASYVQQPGGLQAVPPRAPVPVTPPVKGALEEVTDLFKRMISPETATGKAAGAVFRYAAPPLAGLQAGSETGALISELDKPKPNYGKVISRGVGALGAIGSLFPATAPIGIPMAIAGPLMAEAIERGEGRPLGQMGDVVAP